MNTPKRAWIAYAAGNRVIECRSREHAEETADEQMLATGDRWAVTYAECTADGWLTITPPAEG